jgi:hypothetical protein
MPESQYYILERQEQHRTYWERVVSWEQSQVQQLVVDLPSLEMRDRK